MEQYLTSMIHFLTIQKIIDYFPYNLWTENEEFLERFYIFEFFFENLSDVWTRNGGGENFHSRS